MILKPFRTAMTRPRIRTTNLNISRKTSQTTPNPCRRVQVFVDCRLNYGKSVIDEFHYFVMEYPFFGSLRDNLLSTIFLVDHIAAFALLRNLDKFSYILSVQSPYLTL